MRLAKRGRRRKHVWEDLLIMPRPSARIRGMKLPRYSLRTLFVLIFVIAVPLGWVNSQRNIVKARKRWAQNVVSRGGSTYPLTSTPPPPLPWYRTVFGDRPVVRINMYRHYLRADLDEIKSLFPEAKITVDFPPSD